MNGNAIAQLVEFAKTVERTLRPEDGSPTLPTVNAYNWLKSYGLRAAA